ncbi:filamentous hemagglutinin N-terminal domain-containing protein [Plectonema radiosum NIES-515]|uniref:Filamentous hemagglutinin N-terminal domain-containing protein n=1 Tax=Plectonema radiosum NIES-515 TaxID=2986073 RepID=A0ABT3AUV4_9CYAN|nr:filamentous hemagglutinin N-terminal domain-containing protein [Plectonema radiosum]MCV3212886.1 filamentous hemagglutinin N-terminal domain-containing protein [Plectonema radiosum NIES-515]
MIKQTNYFWIAGLGFLCFLTKTDVIQAQITSDRTLSTEVLTTNNLDFTIINGNRVGNNLFHSFRELSVPTGGSAFFTNDLNVQNIINRVTGGSISKIDGLLKTNGSANLFLINPNGIIFGENASLNINGSFVTSTANNIIFADGTQFSATNLETPPLLTVSVPIGLQFGQIAQPIQIYGSRLEVMPGNTLAILGGDVLVKGARLAAPAGRIDLGSVASNSLVSLNPISEWALGYKRVQNFQDIQVSQAAFIYTSGEGNGAIQLRGRDIAIADNSQLIAFTVGQEPGQPLVIKASESVKVSSSSQLLTGTEENGPASDINIETKRLIVRDGGFIEASTFGSGAGGNIRVDASESVELLGNGFYTSLGTQTLGRNNNAGNAGTVNISTGKLILRDGGRILTSTASSGNAGTLKIDASESVEASGRAVLDTNLPSGLLAETTTSRVFIPGTGNGGDLIINTQRLLVQDGASISTAAINGSTGQAGRLDINASNSVTVTGSSRGGNGQIVRSTLLAASDGFGNAGDLIINTNKLTVRDGAQVSVSSTGFAPAGNLEITSGVLLLDNQGKLTAETRAGEGNINLRSLNLILRRGSTITTNARGNNITGGNINIDAKNGFIVAVRGENSDISANSADFRGGNVTIDASGIFGTQFRNAPTLESEITATGANPSLSGNVQINTPNLDPTRGLVKLSSDVVNQSRLIAQGCPASRGDVFIITGRGGLPPLPSEALRSNQTATINWVTQGERRKGGEGGRITKVSGSKLANQIVPATGWVINDKGEVTLIASTANTTLQNSTPTTCPFL